jgi:hypothetical protein
MILNLFKRVNCTSRSNKQGSTTRAISVRIFNAAIAWKSAAYAGQNSTLQLIMEEVMIASYLVYTFIRLIPFPRSWHGAPKSQGND